MCESILIVGGNGFIGRNLTLYTVKNGYRTTVLSLNTLDVEEKIEGVNYIQADITNFKELQERVSVRSFDYVVNLSGYIDHSVFLEGGNEVMSVHFDGLRNILKLINWRRVKRFVQIGSSDEYGNLPAPQNEEMREAPISPYSLGKVASTHLLQMLYRTENFPVVILRLFLVYGPGQSDNRFLPQIIQACASGSSFPTSAGEQLRDFCYVDDIIGGIILSLRSHDVNGEVINLASGNPISIHDIINYVINRVGQGIPEFGKVPYRVGENMKLYADISKANKILGWSPHVPIEDGIGALINSYNI